MKLYQFILSALTLTITVNASAQQVDQERMNRDIKVAENVLVTLVKQKLDGDRMFFPLNVTGSYQEGFGITFMLPADYTTPIAFGLSRPDQPVFPRDSRVQGVTSGPGRNRTPQNETRNSNDWALKDRRQLNLDSLRDLSNARVIEAAKEFLVDYGDMLSQVPADEKILITNRGNQPRMWVGALVPAPERTYLSIEMKKADLNDMKEGNIGRDELLKRISIVTAKATDEVEPDLELLSTIFSRLYRPDLSKTFFIEGTVPYERLKDFGVVYYMQVYSANRTFNSTYDMPTVGLHDISQAQRDEKVKQLYPRFEQELKENIIEYGRTLKSLEGDEQLIFNVSLTQCLQCNIPSTLELSVEGSVLKSYNEGKTNKDAAISSISLKRGPDQ
ncbi:MAG TPA: hypothetical protein VKZ75_07125 [Cyclobacteriaceae bacterium]|nr:hypothetical protein [Cyclobacteriaceae bacterium]